MYSGWLQSCNFKCEEFKDISNEKALELFEKHDWAFEQNQQNELDKRGEESCDAGLGIIHEKGHILHVCPDGKGINMIHYHFKDVAKFLGVFHIRKESNQTIENLSNDDVRDHINKFYENGELNRIL
jgi:hypothetical protein